MTTTTAEPITEAAVAPDAVAAAAEQIADRLRTKTIDQVIEIGERTGWWTPELVDWVADGCQGPPPEVLLTASVTETWPPVRDLPPASPPAPDPEVERLVELEDELADRGVIDPTVVPDAATEPASDLEPAADVPRDVAPPADERAAVPPEDAAVASSAYIAVLQAREFGVDHSYQRPLDEPRVRRMVAAWDPRMVGVLDVSDRGPDRPAGTPRYAVINGQHRAAAAARVSPAGADIWMACNVHEGLTVADEARLMHELDRTTKKLIGWDKWRARRVAGDEAVLAVERIAAAHGLRVDDAIADGTMRSYGAAEKLLARGGERLLDSTLAVLRAAYGTTAAAYQAPLLTGVGQLLQTYSDAVVHERLVKALASTKPEQIRATATAMRDIDGGALHEVMTRALVGQYNRTSGPGMKLDSRRG